MSHPIAQKIPIPKLDGIPTTTPDEKLEKAIICLVRALRENVGRQHLRGVLAALYQGLGLQRDLADRHLAIIEHYLDHKENRWVSQD
ncbi:MAG: hypothetical protein KBC26_03400 [Candidatus Pacebacteria bacterium]|nr:hypothetical protein [Candidatus Paceibacterota bacterium]